MIDFNSRSSLTLNLLSRINRLYKVFLIDKDQSCFFEREKIIINLSLATYYQFDNLFINISIFVRFINRIIFIYEEITDVPRYFSHSVPNGGRKS